MNAEWIFSHGSCVGVGVLETLLCMQLVSCLAACTCPLEFIWDPCGTRCGAHHQSAPCTAVGCTDSRLLCCMLCHAGRQLGACSRRQPSLVPLALQNVPSQAASAGAICVLSATTGLRSAQLKVVAVVLRATPVIAPRDSCFSLSDSCTHQGAFVQQGHQLETHVCMCIHCTVWCTHESCCELGENKEMPHMSPLQVNAT